MGWGHRRPTIEPHLTAEFKNLVDQEARVIKQDANKDGWMRAYITSQAAHAKSVPGYEAATLGDLGPTPQFTIRGLTDRESGKDFGDAKDYYTSLTYDDIRTQILEKPEVLKRVYGDAEMVSNELTRKARAAGIQPTNTQKAEFRKLGVREALLKNYYYNEKALMGEIQRDAVVDQSLMVSVAKAATQAELRKFRPDYLKDMFPEGILPYTSKRVLELRALGKSSEEIEKQIQVEENFFRQRGIKVDDRNLASFNTFINACLTQALADTGMHDLDIDTLKAKDPTYALDPEHSNMKERAQKIMRHVKDPKTAWVFWMLEQEEMKRRENWF